MKKTNKELYEEAKKEIWDEARQRGDSAVIGNKILFRAMVKAREDERKALIEEIEKDKLQKAIITAFEIELEGEKK